MSWGEAHTSSEQFATAAEIALRSGNREEAERLYREAAERETVALDSLDHSKPRTYGITAVSATALWYKASAYRFACEVAYRALASGNVPQFAERQLQELLPMVWAAEAADKSGRRFMAGDVLVSVQGGVVVHGGAPLDLIKQKVDGIQAVLFRVLELLLGHEPRRRGSPPSEIVGRFRPWLFQAPAGSYQFAVRVEAPKQMEMFKEHPEVEQVTSMFLAILRASASDPDVELAALVPDDRYREVFVNLSRNLAPTGRTFERLQVRDASRPAMDAVTFEAISRRQLNATAKKMRPPQTASPEETVEVRGVLRGLDLNDDWLVVDLPEGESARIHEAGDVLDDVIGPLVNQRVVVTAVRSKGRLVYRDIEADD